MFKKIFFILIFSLLGLPAQASVTDNISNYAWSENIGWISFNCTNTVSCATSNYGVTINPSTGAFSGYAWSENIGWIHFAPAGPYPASPNYSACLDMPGNGQACDGIGNYNVGGWARALSYGGGWDGWIKLKGSNYGVFMNKQTGKMSGYAWSGMVIGWISFSGTGYGTTVNLSIFNSAPNKPGIDPGYLPDGLSWNNCSFKGISTPTFHWTYSDPDSDPQSAYEIEIDDSAAFLTPKFNHLVNLGATSYVLNLSQDDPVADWISQLSWGTNYFWRARVKDSQGNWSDWSNSTQFKTPDHAYPYPDFTWTPAEPTQGETVKLDPDISEAFGGAVISSYFWTVTQGTGVFADGTSASSHYPHIQFSTLNSKVRLQVTDSQPGYSCGTAADGAGEKSITAELPLPDYKEVPPTSWLKRIFASVSDFLN